MDLLVDYINLKANEYRIKLLYSDHVTLGDKINESERYHTFTYNDDKNIHQVVLKSYKGVHFPELITGEMYILSLNLKCSPKLIGVISEANNFSLGMEPVEEKV